MIDAIRRWECKFYLFVLPVVGDWNVQTCCSIIRLCHSSLRDIELNCFRLYANDFSFVEYDCWIIIWKITVTFYNDIAILKYCQKKINLYATLIANHFFLSKILRHMKFYMNKNKHLLIPTAIIIRISNTLLFTILFYLALNVLSHTKHDNDTLGERPSCWTTFII